MVEQDELNLQTAHEALVTRALQRRPAVIVPDGFSARVVTFLQVAAPQPAVKPAARVASAATALVLTLVMFYLAPEAKPALTNLAFCLEMLMLVELGGIGWLLSMRRTF